MPDQPTPGQIAYTAYAQTRYGMPPDAAALTYAASVPDEREAWEAAAAALITAWIAGADWPTPGEALSCIPAAQPPEDAGPFALRGTDQRHAVVCRADHTHHATQKETP